MKNIDIWNDLGNLYLKANAIDAAIDAYNKAIEQGYRTGDIYKNLASAYLCQGNIHDSIPFYQKSIELLSSNKEKAVLFTQLGDCYRRLEDFDNAIASFRSAIELEPGNPALCVGLNDVQHDLEKIFSFEENTEVPNAEGSNFESELNKISPELLSNEPVNDTLSTSDETIQMEIEPDHVEEFLSREEMVQEETAIPNIDPGEAPVVEGDANNSGFLHSPIEAETLVLAELGIKASQGLVGSENALKDTDFSLCDIFVPDCNEESLTDETLEDESSVDVEANREKAEGVRVTLLLTLGIMHWRNGSLEEADRILHSAVNASLKIKNNWFEALSWHALALVKTALGNILGAIHAYLRAVELAPDQIFPWNNIGDLYSSLGRTDEALNAFQKAIRENPEDSVSWNGLGDIYTRLGRLEDAIAAYQLGNVFESRAQGNDAIKTYEKAFDFYKFTIASFEDEITSSNSTEVSEADKSINDLEDQTAFEEIETPETNSSEWVDSGNLNTILDHVQVLARLDTEQELKISASPSDVEKTSQVGENNDDRITELSDVIGNQPEFADQPDVLGVNENPLDSSSDTGLEALDEKSNNEITSPDNLSDQEENDPQIAKEMDFPQSNGAENESTIAPEIEIASERLHEVDNFSNNAGITIVELPSLEGELEFSELEAVIQADEITAVMPECSEETKVANTFERSEAVLESELVENRVSDEQISETGFSSSEKTEIAEDENLETVKPVILENPADQTKPPQQDSSIESENARSIDELSVELEGSVPLGEIETPQSAIGEPTLELTEPGDQAASGQLNSNPVIDVQNWSEPEQKITEVPENCPEVGMLPIVTVEPSPRSDADRVMVTITSYEAVVRENPANDRAWDSLGNLYRITQRYSDAIHAFERAVALEPEKYVYHYQLGTLYASEGKYENAIQEIEKVVELNPSFIFAHCALASYLRKVGKDDEAQGHISIALPQMVKEKEYDRACFESIRGNIDEALNLLAIALEKKQTTFEWIQRDLDLDFIRQDSRYQLLATRSAKSIVDHR